MNIACPPQTLLDQFVQTTKNCQAAHQVSNPDRPRADKSKYGERPIEYINTHGTSTPVGDLMELGAIKRTFDPLGYKPKVGSTKSLSGHSLGAAGVHEAIYSLLMMEKGFLAKSANIEELVDEAADMDILQERHEGKVNRVISNSFGFGGTNACLCFDRYEE